MIDKLSEDNGIFIEKFDNFDQNINVNENDIIEALKKVFDPEIPVNIYDLGLIYNISIEPNLNVDIKMTLTAPNCPVAGEMPGMVGKAVKKLNGFKGVKVELVWEPPWSKDMMSDDAKLALDI
tara:strand:- start:333 stop:701 length:369 start_codon:yes stop_codon:yes gene_type:complete